MSMGSLILAGGAEGKRAALPNSRILIHQPSGGFQGQETDIQIHAKEALELRRRVEEIYALHTGRTREQISDDLERDRFFTPDEARDYGLIDRVCASRNGNLERQRRSVLVVAVVLVERLGGQLLAADVPQRGSRGSPSGRRRAPAA